MKQLSSGLHVPISYTPPPTRGYNGRESVATVQSGYKSQFNVLSPDASGSWKVQRLTPKELASMSVRDILSNLIRNSASMSFAVQTYTDACVMGYDIVSESDRSVDIAKDFIRRIENGDQPFLSHLRKDIYSIKVEGGLAKEVYFDQPGGMGVGMVNISPFGLRFREVEDPVHGTYYQTVQYKDNNILSEPIVLQDKVNPNPTFVYYPVNQLDNQPFGSPPMAPSIFGTLSITELANLIQQYLVGQTSPQGVLQVPRSPLQQAGYSTEQISGIVKDTVEDIKKELSKGDATQTLTADTEVLYTALGVLANARLDGLDVFSEFLERELQRGLRMPDSVFPSKGRVGGLGSGEFRVQFQLWETDLSATTEVAEIVNTALINEVVFAEGGDAPINIIIYRENLETNRIRAEYLELQDQRYKSQQQDGVISREERRRLSIAEDPNMTNFDPEDVPEMIPQAPAPETDDDTNASQNGTPPTNAHNGISDLIRGH